MPTKWNINPDPVFGPDPGVDIGQVWVQDQFEHNKRRALIDAAMEKLGQKLYPDEEPRRKAALDPSAETYRAASVIAGRALSAALTNPAILSLLLADDTGLAAAKLAKLVVDVASDVAVQLRAKVPEKLSLENPP